MVASSWLNSTGEYDWQTAIKVAASMCQPQPNRTLTLTVTLTLTLMKMVSNMSQGETGVCYLIACLQSSAIVLRNFTSPPFPQNVILASSTEHGEG